MSPIFKATGFMLVLYVCHALIHVTGAHEKRFIFEETQDGFVVNLNPFWHSYSAASTNNGNNNNGQNENKLNTDSTGPTVHETPFQGCGMYEEYNDLLSLKHAQECHTIDYALTTLHALHEYQHGTECIRNVIKELKVFFAQSDFSSKACQCMGYVAYNINRTQQKANNFLFQNGSSVGPCAHHSLVWNLISSMTTNLSGSVDCQWEILKHFNGILDIQNSQCTCENVSFHLSLRVLMPNIYRNNADIRLDADILDNSGETPTNCVDETYYQHDLAYSHGIDIRDPQKTGMDITLYDLDKIQVAKRLPVAGSTTTLGAYPLNALSTKHATNTTTPTPTNATLTTSFTSIMMATPSQLTVTYACMKAPTISSIAHGLKQTNTQAGDCHPGSKDHVASEALVINMCKTLEPHNWKEGQHVMLECYSIPLYTPVATFFDGKYSSQGGLAGIFVGCIEEGFKMIVQECDRNITVMHVTTGGHFLMDPRSYSIVN